MTIDIPHTLGRAEARRRIAARLGDLDKHMPGGGTATTRWTDDDHLAVDARAFGQSVAAKVEIAETAVRITLALPLMLSFMAGPIGTAIRTKGTALLAPKPA